MDTIEDILIPILVVVFIACVAGICYFLFEESQENVQCKSLIMQECKEKNYSPTDCRNHLCLQCEISCGEDIYIY